MSAVIDPRVARWVATAIRDRAAVWRKNGLEPPAEVLALAEVLLPAVPPTGLNRDGGDDPAERARRMARERTRRWRARQRGESIPLRQPGRPKTVTKVAS